mmetsp:Transcript_27508/g.69370  ORF Transcript_27508/g.69370 Transcript_27508/m.69370 type:complete len:330 (-) Transcript_27508:264-1253(-)
MFTSGWETILAALVSNSPNFFSLLLLFLSPPPCINPFWSAFASSSPCPPPPPTAPPALVPPSFQGTCNRTPRRSTVIPVASNLRTSISTCLVYCSCLFCSFSSSSFCSSSPFLSISKAFSSSRLFSTVASVRSSADSSLDKVKTSCWSWWSSFSSCWICACSSPRTRSWKFNSSTSDVGCGAGGLPRERSLASCSAFCLSSSTSPAFSPFFRWISSCSLLRSPSCASSNRFTIALVSACNRVSSSRSRSSPLVLDSDATKCSITAFVPYSRWFPTCRSAKRSQRVASSWCSRKSLSALVGVAGAAPTLEDEEEDEEVKAAPEAAFRRSC